MDLFNPCNAAHGVSSAATTKTSAKQHSGLLTAIYGKRSLWNYGHKHFAIERTPSALPLGHRPPGLLNLVACNTFDSTITNGLVAGEIFALSCASVAAVLTLTRLFVFWGSNPNRTQSTMSDKRVGDLLNLRGATWGSFMVGFAKLSHQIAGTTV